MEMLLMGACLSVLGLAIACIAFGAATRAPYEYTTAAPVLANQAAKDAAKGAAPERFFADPVLLPQAARTRVPIEALLLEIENHVRLEQAAAQCFLESPNASMLHSRTISTFVN